VRLTRVGVVGGGNSAGQAAVWLARGGALVTLLHRRSDLRETMSDYLIQELEQAGVAVHPACEVVELHGNDGHLEAVTLSNGERVAFSFLSQSVHGDAPRNRNSEQQSCGETNALHVSLVS
jgi:thioredoxin reductase